jgi:hypothetical protein
MAKRGEAERHHRPGRRLRNKCRDFELEIVGNADMHPPTSAAKETGVEVIIVPVVAPVRLSKYDMRKGFTRCL